MNRLDQYSKYAQSAIDSWNQQEDAHLRQHPVILPVYSKLRQRLNQAMMHVTRSLQRLVQPIGRWLVRGVAREWRSVMLPGYELPMPTGRQLEWVAEQVNQYWQRFAKWSIACRLQDYPLVKEKAVRLLWFGAYRVAATGKLPKHLEAIFAYATLYPLVDEAFDDPQLSKQAKQEMVNELIAELEGKKSQPSIYPRTPLFDLCAGQVKAAMNSLPVQREMRDCLELLAWLEGDQTGFNDQLMCTCLKGSLSLIPVYFLADETVAYEQVFRMGLAMQLVDDLQDAMIDLPTSAPNIFSQAIRNGLNPTPLIIKSLNFISAQDYALLKDPLATFVEASMWRMLSYLMTEASFLHAAAIGQPFMLTLHRHLPFPLSLITHYPMETKLYRLVEILTTE